MSKKIVTTGHLTDAQIRLIYATAEKFKVGVSLFGNTPAPDRSSFTWLTSGGVFRVRQFKKFLRSLR